MGRVRLQAPYLREWVLYHYLIGIQHFFLYDNESDDDPQRELQPFVDRGLVTLTFWPLPQKEYVAQFAQVANCLNTTVGAPLASSEWMAAFDLDEMLVVLTQYPSAAPFAGLEPFALHELLSGFPESGFGAVHCACVWLWGRRRRATLTPLSRPPTLTSPLSLQWTATYSPAAATAPGRRA